MKKNIMQIKHSEIQKPEDRTIILIKLHRH